MYNFKSKYRCNKMKRKGSQGNDAQQIQNDE